MTATETLPFELPTYKGKPPVGMKTAINGTGNRIQAAGELGQKRVLVIEVEQTNAGHQLTDKGVFYSESYKVEDVFEVSGDQGKALINGLRQKYQGDTEGVLPGTNDTEVDLGDKVITDSSGVVMTPAEKAEALDELVDPELVPCVIVFDDTSRGLWPNDWEGLGQSKGGIGMLMRRPGSKTAGDTARIVKILDAGTGETIEEWTEDQEGARLLELEKDAERAEATLAEHGKDVADAVAAVDLDADDIAAHVEYLRRVLKKNGLEVDEGQDVAVVARLLLEDDELDKATRVLVETTVEEVEKFRAATEEWIRTDHPDAPDDELEADVDDNAEDLRSELAAATKQAADAGADVVDLDERRGKLPGPPEFSFVDRKVDEVKADLERVTDHAHALRLIKAEEQGRGRDLKPRKGVLEMLEKRARELYLAEPTPEPDLGETFEVPEDAVANEQEEG